MGEPATEQPGADTQSPNPDPAEGTPGQGSTAPNTPHPNTAAPGRKRQSLPFAKGPVPERIEEEKAEKPAPAELTIAERRIKERLEQHWHEPDPWAGPIDSTTPGRSPPW